jgi:phosphocarrier protein HPr
MPLRITIDENNIKCLCALVTIERLFYGKNPFHLVVNFSPREKHHHGAHRSEKQKTHSSIMSNQLAVVRALLAHDSNGATSLVRAAALNCMRKEVEIINKLGLHARPASHFVRCVIRFKSKITICKGDENFSAASILEVLSADLDCGARVVLEAIGPDEQEALNQLEALLLRFRDEEGGAQGN